MTAVIDQLRLLRRDAGMADEIAIAPSATPASARLDALRRLTRSRSEFIAKRPLEAPAGVEIAAGVRYVERTIPYEAASTLRVPIDEKPIDRRRLLCFDTETTGLAGGVGTRAFMIGVASWRDQQLTVRQMYLTTVAGEAAMLRVFAGWLGDDTVLVSYNGKSYDSPLLKGRMCLNRIDHALDALPHLDWLHPVRRVYRGVFDNCRLATIERQVLNIMREDDLPGSQAPAAWLAYLRGQSSRNLLRVIGHNQQDVITLMRLGDHMERGWWSYPSDPTCPNSDRRPRARQMNNPFLRAHRALNSTCEAGLVSTLSGEEGPTRICEDRMG